MWKNIQINKQNIKVETEKSILIKCPKNSRYDGYEFWHPSKLVRKGNHKGAVSIGYTDDFKFTLKKMGNGKYNFKDVIDTKEITINDFEIMFEVMSENIIEPKIDTESYANVEEPVKIIIDGVVVAECLKNN